MGPAREQCHGNRKAKAKGKLLLEIGHKPHLVVHLLLCPITWIYVFSFQYQIHRVGQQCAYSCEYMKYRVHSYIIIYLSLYYFPYEQL